MDLAEQQPAQSSEAASHDLNVVKPSRNLPLWAGLALTPVTVAAALVLLYAMLWLTRGVLGVDPATSPWFDTGVLIFQEIMFVVVAFVLAYVTVGVGVLREYLTLPRSATAATIGGIAVITTFLWSLIIISVIVKPSGSLSPEPVQADQGLALVIATMVMIAVVGPLTEELTVRGFIFSALRGRLGLVGGVLGSGVIFGLMHAGNFNFASDKTITAVVALTVFGCGLALLRYRTGSLLPGIIVHSLNNAVVVSISQDLDVAVAIPFCLGAMMASTAVFLLARRLWALPTDEPKPEEHVSDHARVDAQQTAA